MKTATPSRAPAGDSADGDERERARRRPGRTSWLVPETAQLRRTVGVLLAVVAIAAGFLVVRDFANRLPGDAAFRIGDRVVSTDELRRRVEVLKGLYGIQPPEDPSELDRFRRDTAKAVAVSDILDGAAREEGIQIPRKNVQDQLGEIVRASYDGDRAALTKMLGDKGLSEQDVLDEIENQLQNVQLFSRVTASVQPATDQQAREYYDANKQLMVSPEQRRLSNIVVSSEAEAADVLRRARSGEDFARLAEERSLDEQTKSNGGDLGMLAKEDLEPEYAEAAFGVRDRELFGPVRSESGWNVGRVAAVQPAVPLSFEQLKETIKKKLADDAKLSRWRDWLGERIRQAKVEYADEYRPSNPDAPPSGVSTVTGEPR